MKTAETVGQLRAVLSNAPSPIGLVPTMGFLHEGHLSLIARCREECRTVVVSIFVNPTQFGPNEDLDTYPRDIARDLAMCDAAGVDIVFSPSTSEMYPAGHATSVEVGRLADPWEGARGPGHFRGVATIVAKLFRATRPQRAYFGEKDFQQLLVVRRMSADLLLDVEVVGCPTVRERDGLALSSRNAYLDAKERPRAIALWEALQAAQRRFSEGERSGPALTAAMKATIDAVQGVTLDYAAVVDAQSLEPLEIVRGEARTLVAARVGGVRLIDNAPLAVN